MNQATGLMTTVIAVDVRITMANDMDVATIFFYYFRCQSYRKLDSKEIRCSNVQEVVKIPIYGFTIWVTMLWTIKNTCLITVHSNNYMFWRHHWTIKHQSTSQIINSIMFPGNSVYHLVRSHNLQELNFSQRYCNFYGIKMATKFLGIREIPISWDLFYVFWEVYTWEVESKLPWIHA